jgi:hypothetical protein
METCVCCGAIIPEGQQACPKCLVHVKSPVEELQKLEAENRRLYVIIESLKQDRDYYRDAYHHLMKGRENDG